MKRFFSSLFALALAVLSLIPSPALANSAQTYWQGTTLTGAQVQDKDCPLVVDHEDLTFSISQFPKINASQQEAQAYDSSVTAEYTFRNPADYTVTATLSFPFGQRPDYDPGWEDRGRYGVAVNGGPIDAVLRHTYSPQFSLSDLDLLRDGLLEDSFFSPELPVTRVTYTVSGVDTEKYPAASAGFTYIPRPESTRFLLPHMGGSSFGEGRESLHTWLDQNGSFDLYILGQAPEPLPQWTCYENGAMEKEIPGALSPQVTEILTFRELVLRGYDPKAEVSETDWYNAVVSYLKWNTIGEAILDSSAPLELMQWYQYQLTLAPGETLKNTVAAPLYPIVNSGYAPPVYTYEYLLSPAKTWKTFGDLDIRIETPFFMVDNEDALRGFTKDEGGYSLHLPGLPDEELTFSLSTEAKPKRVHRSSSYMLQILLPILLPLAGLPLAIVLFVHSHRKKRGKPKG